MEQVKSLLEARAKQLLQLKEEKEKALRDVPEGFLRICKCGDRTQYYQRTDPKDFGGKYIRDKDIRLAGRLAQKDYDQRVLKAIEKELRAIQKYMAGYPTLNAEQIYEKMHKERQKLITPIVETEEQYVQRWEGISYQGKEFQEEAPEFYTAKGERVRSKSEVIIADLLSREGIPYHYEKAVWLTGMGEVYPDFTVLDVKQRREIYWEHLGMMDDSFYAEKALRKIAAYEENEFYVGDNLIITYETKKNPINQKHLLQIIRHYLH